MVGALARPVVARLTALAVALLVVPAAARADTSIVSGPPTVSGSPDATFELETTDLGATLECALDADPFSACLSPVSYFALTDGGHVFRVRSVTLGVPDPSPASWSWTIDTRPPAVGLTATPPSSTNATTAGFAFSVDDPDATVICELDDVPSPCDSPGSQAYTGLAEGQHTFRALATDAAGNTGDAVFIWTVDLTGPLIGFSVAPAALTNNPVATFSITSSEPATMQCALDGGAWQPCAAAVVFTGLADGPHTLTVRATDAAGNVGSSSRFWTQDTVRPQTQITAGPATSAPVNSRLATFMFTSAEGVSFECALDGMPFAPCSSPKVYTALSEATHTFEVRAVDAAGNVDGTPAERTWTVSLTPTPAARIAVRPESDGFLLDASKSSSPVGGPLRYRWQHGGEPAGTGATLRFSSPAGVGADTFTVTVTDVSGAQDTASVSFTTSARSELARFRRLEVIRFSGGEHLAAGARARIAALKPVVEGAEDLLVEGHASAPGSAVARRRLAAARAALVRALLVPAGSRAPRAVRVVGRENASPPATQRTAAGRSMNNRVVVTVTYRRPARYLVTRQDGDASVALSSRPDPVSTSTSGPVPKLFAFYSRTAGSLTRLEQVGGRVSVLAPNWYSLDTRTAAIGGGVPDPRVMDLSRKLGFKVWPVVNATIGASTLLDTPAGRARVAGHIAALAARYRLSGVTLDMEDMQPAGRTRFTAMVRRLAQGLHRHGRTLAVYAVRRTRTQVQTSAAAYDWRRLAAAADLLLASGYNEHGQGTRPGPVTTARGFQDLTAYAAGVSRRNVAPLMGAFGYRWSASGGRATLVPSAVAELRWPSPAEIGSADGRHVVSGGSQIYYEAAEDLWAREQAVRRKRIRWIGLFSLGREPARFWERSRLGRSAVR